MFLLQLLTQETKISVMIAHLQLIQVLPFLLVLKKWLFVQLYFHNLKYNLLSEKEFPNQILNIFVVIEHKKLKDALNSPLWLEALNEALRVLTRMTIGP